MVYTYRVLRYVHDVVAEEFVNVMIVALCNGEIHTRTPDDFTRVKNFFENINIEFLKSQLHQTCEFLHQVNVESAKDVGSVCELALSIHDGGLIWSPHVGGGITHDINHTLDNLKRRFIM